MAEVLSPPQHQHQHQHLHIRHPSLSSLSSSSSLSLSSPSSVSLVVRPSMAALSPLPGPAAQKPIPAAEQPATTPPPPKSETAEKESTTTEAQVDNPIKRMWSPILGIDFTRSARPRRASTHLISVGTSAQDLHDVFNDSSATNLVSGVGSGCCGGGGCCRLSSLPIPTTTPSLPAFAVSNNRAFKSLKLKLGPLNSGSRLTGTTPLPVQKISINPVQEEGIRHESTAFTHPPKFVTPHPPYSVFSAKINNTRELTKSGAEKRTYHFDLDVTDYPEEAPGVDFRVGGAIGVCAPNDLETVDEIFDILGVSLSERDETVTLQTQGGRWPTIWGKEEERSLVTTRRELLTWTVDIQSYPPTKSILRLLAEYAKDEGEKMILLYLCSMQGQAAFCELRTGPFVSLLQLLNAFPSSKPPFAHLLCNLPNLMPRFYSLSNDPHESRSENRRIIEVAVSVHESTENWRDGVRTGTGSGFFERCARRILDDGETEVRVPMFRGLMANPLAREFVTDGPMLLIGAGVGIAPFRGFVQRRLMSANCANKVWVIQGIRDSLLDEIYSGEWGEHEDKIRKVVESRVGTCRYVQEEVLAQAELVWLVINALDGRVFVCGSSKGMGEGVEAALVKVVMERGKLSESEAREFWKKKKEGGQYIAETW